MGGRINVVLDADIEGFFDHIDKKWMMRMVEHRIKDGSLLRLLCKWLHAGVLEEGRWYDPSIAVHGGRAQPDGTHATCSAGQAARKLRLSFAGPHSRAAVSFDP